MSIDDPPPGPHCTAAPLIGTCPQLSYTGWDLEKLGVLSIPKNPVHYHLSYTTKHVPHQCHGTPYFGGSNGLKYGNPLSLTIRKPSLLNCVN